MRIAHVITRLILGGAQENTVLCCQDLLQQFGDDVVLITGPPLGPEGSLIDDAAGRGVPTKIIPSMRRAIHPWRDAAAYRQIKRALSDFSPDVVHTHSAKAGILGRYAATSLRVPAVVHTVHGAPFHPYQNPASRWVFKTCERQAARRCHAIVSVSDAMTELMVNANVAPRDKFVTVYSGMEVEPFLNAEQSRQRVRSEFGYTDQHVVVGKVARLFRLKGHRDVIRAARGIIDQQPNLRFLFVGDGTLRQELQRELQQSGLQDRFRFTGLVTPARVAELMGAMDLLVHASLREGLARALPQALIAGRPAVSYDIDGAREVVIDGDTGRLVPPGDVSQLGDAIKALANDPVARDRMGEAGRRRCRDLFRHETMTERLRALYQRLLANPGKHD